MSSVVEFSSGDFLPAVLEKHQTGRASERMMGYNIQILMIGMRAFFMPAGHTNK
jgi:hypothetical protein